jgi:hypothetical protein
MIEELFKAHQHTIAAIAAAGTIGAVLTSLWLAWRANRADRTRLKAGADIVLIFHMPIDGKTVPKFLRVSITNRGKWPLRIPAFFFYWKIPFKRGVMQVTPLDVSGSPLIPPKRYPVEISPRASENFHISDLPAFEQEAKRVAGAETFADRLRFRFIKAYVRTDDGETFRVKLSPKVREVWSRQTLA